MASWKLELKDTKGTFPFKATCVAKNGKKFESGEFITEKAAKSWAQMDLMSLNGVLSHNKPTEEQPINASKEQSEKGKP